MLLGKSVFKFVASVCMVMCDVFCLFCGPHWGTSVVLLQEIGEIFGMSV